MPESDFEIFPPHEAFYIFSLLSCTQAALISADWISELLHKDGDAIGKIPPAAILNDLQNIALQSGAISRFFWPVDEQYQRRGSYLRQCFSIQDDNPLRSRELRNRMEHYDEYLDDYFARGFMVGHIIPDYVGPTPGEEEVSYHLFRAFFTDTGSVSILGVSFELQPVIDAIQDLHHTLVKCESNGCRFPQI